MKNIPHTRRVGRQPGQQKCSWCGDWCYSLKPCFDDDTRHELVHYVHTHGRCWKRDLRNSWMNGIYLESDNSQILQSLRNGYGPAWLERIKTGFIVAWGRRFVSKPHEAPPEIGGDLPYQLN